MRTRLAKRPPVYDGVRSNFDSINHTVRALTTGALIAAMKADTICDPACGDASILGVSWRIRPFTYAHLADISAAQIHEIHPEFPHEKRVANIEDTLNSIDKVDCIILTEILEHLVDPDSILRLARTKGASLVASSPIGDPEFGRNEEHLWSWDELGYQQMLTDAGWNLSASMSQVYWGSPYNSQILVAL